jgi:hypothetical protein
MHEALLRAAQQSRSVTNEESVARFQSERVTRQVYERSALPLPKPPAPARTAGSASPGSTLLWPYPRGSADIIDRANCADLFLRAHSRFRVVTEDGLDRDAWVAADPAESIMLFCPFDAVLPRLSVTPDNLLAVDGRPVDAVASEMIVGFLMRAGLWPKPARGVNFTHIPAIDRLRTRLVNGTGLALFKAAQMAHFQRHRHDLPDLGTTLPQGRIGWDRAEVLAASEEWLARGYAVVYRPFASSRGTAVSFLSPHECRRRRRAVEDVLDAMEAAMADKYGHADPYPITLSTFVESRKIDGRACELRMFVVADPSAAAIRAIPGMVCLTQVPFGERAELDASTCSTNLTASLNSVAASGHRELPLSDPDVLTALGLGVKRLELLGRFAALLWSRAVAAERAVTGMALPFAYGSVDFLISEDGRVAPVEMNGANVGAHSAVHPQFLDAFGVAMRTALEGVVFQDSPDLVESLDWLPAVPDRQSPRDRTLGCS